MRIRPTRAHLASFVACLAFAMLFSGCSSDATSDLSKKPILNESETNIVGQQADSRTTSVAATKTPGDESPAASANKIPSSDATPAVVCEKFLKLLQAGNRITAEQLLTRRALTVIATEQWELTPLGSSSAKFEVSETLYATKRMELAHVSCEIVDTVDGKTTTTPVTWMVRKKKEGWRISGMLLPNEENDQLDLLSFENPNDVRLMLESTSTEVDSESLSQN